MFVSDVIFFVMRMIFIGLVLILLLLSGYAFYKYREIFFEMKKKESEIATRQKELLLLYESKLKELEEDYLSLLAKERYLKGKDRDKLKELEEKIKEMKEIIREWQSAAEEEKQNTLYRICVETYPQTRGLCEYLKERTKK